MPELIAACTGTCLLCRVFSVEQFQFPEKPELRRSGQVKAWKRHGFK